MNVVPVADQSEDQQNERDQQQPCRLRRVDRVPALPVLIRLLLGGRYANVMRRHTDIVAPRSLCC